MNPIGGKPSVIPEPVGSTFLLEEYIFTMISSVYDKYQLLPSADPLDNSSRWQTTMSKHPTISTRTTEEMEIKMEYSRNNSTPKSPTEIMTKSANSVRSECTVIHRTSYLETMIHFLKGNIGSGLYAMGDAIKNAGLLFGSLGTIFLGLVCLYNDHILIKSSVKIREKMKLPNEPNMPETIELCFEHGPMIFRQWKNLVKYLVKGFVIATQLGFCSVYFIFVSSTMHLIMKDHGYDYDLKLYMAVSLLPIALSALIRSLKFLTPISLLSNVLMLSGICLTFYLCAQDLPSISKRRLISDFGTLPLFFGTTIYAFEGISLVIPLHNEMKNQKQFSSKLGVLNVGQSFVILLAVSMGCIAYLKFGDDVLGSITLNLDRGLISETVMLTVALAILLSYAIQFHVVVDIIWWDLVAARGPFTHMIPYEMLLRMGLVLFTFVLALVVPHLNLFISLIGAMCSTALALVFPALCDIALRTCPVEEGRLQSRSTIGQAFRFFMDAITIMLALTGFLTGTFYSVVAIAEAFIKET